MFFKKRRHSHLRHHYHSHRPYYRLTKKIPALMSLVDGGQVFFWASAPVPHLDFACHPLTYIFNNNLAITLHPSTCLPLDVAGTPTIKALGATPTIPRTAQRSYNHLEVLTHHYHNNVHNNINNNNNNNTVSATHIQEKPNSFFHSYRSGI